MNEVPQTARMITSHQLISFDETPIFYRRVKSDFERPKAITIIIHGLGEHGGRYQAFAEYLLGLGIESVLPDLRGFGKSGGRRACVSRFSDFHRDLEALHKFIVRNNKGIPLFLIGHSFGGLLASSYLAFSCRSKIQGLVLSSPLFGIAVPVPFWKKVAVLGLSTLWPDYSEPTHVNHALLTHDETLLKLYASDDLIYHKVSARLYYELRVMLQKKDQIAKGLTLPVLLLQAGDDFIVSKDQAIQFYNQLRMADKELEVYKDFYHEILNETRRDIVTSRIGFWLLKQVNHN